MDPDPLRAGYLRTESAGCQVFVPFTLAKGMPSGRTLDAVVTTILDMKFTSRGTVCLSGSTTFLGTLEAIADLDAAEYAFDPPSLWHERLASLAAQRGHRVALARARVGRVDPRPPFQHSIQALRSRCSGRILPTRLDVVFLEFVAVGISQSPIGASNKVMGVVRGRAGEGAGEKSFVFQEIVISTGDPPPRVLVAPSELGAYINFLRIQAKKALASRKPLKAAKRLLSLSRLVGAQTIADFLVAILNKYSSSTTGEAFTKVHKLIKLLPDERREMLGMRHLASSPHTTEPPSDVIRALNAVYNRLDQGFVPLGAPS